MTHADRDRLVTLKKVKKKLITQRQAAEELHVTVRQVWRLLRALTQRGDKAVIHGLRSKPSSQRIPEIGWLPALFNSAVRLHSQRWYLTGL